MKSREVESFSHTFINIMEQDYGAKKPQSVAEWSASSISR